MFIIKKNKKSKKKVFLYSTSLICSLQIDPLGR